MNTPSSVFDESINRWIKENSLPWMKLKTELGLSNLRKHLPGKSLRILDAGGGSGFDSIPLAREGHQIDLMDYSAEMLKVAQKDVEREDLQDRIRLHQADISRLDRIFPRPEFDAVICHNVLQFIGDPQNLLPQMAKILAPGGILSLISGNRYTIPYRTAFYAKDLDQAYRQIGSRNYQHFFFNTEVTEYSADEVREMLPGAGLAFEAHYGIRCLADYWGDNETKLRPEVWEKIVRLEYALTDKQPYNLMARFWQIIARKV
jgi:S-adenosylmethionine-dependent methyltransferase